MTRTFAALLCALLVTGCAPSMSRTDNSARLNGRMTESITHTTANNHRDPLPTASLPDGIYPASQEMLPTTAGRIALVNLNAAIDGLIKGGADQPGNPAVSKLAGLLYHRFKVLGSLDDVDRALALMENIENPSAAELRLRAKLRSGLHRFDAALADVARAEARDQPRTSDADTRRAIALATGKYEQIQDLIDLAEEPSSAFMDSVLRGNVAALKGNIEHASVHFLRAQQAIYDTAPYPVAWLYAQQGIWLMRYGRCADAQPFFEAALARLPNYALALDHRAECLLRSGQLDAARPIYHHLIKQTGNPLFTGTLAVLEEEAGNDATAQELFARANVGWERLLTKESKAWSEHAAEFYLLAGEPERALQLARDNIANRQDVRSLILLARAAEVAGQHREACDALLRAQATGMQPPAFSQYAGELPSGCTTTKLAATPD